MLGRKTSGVVRRKTLDNGVQFKYEYIRTIVGLLYDRFTECDIRGLWDAIRKDICFIKKKNHHHTRTHASAHTHTHFQNKGLDS